MMVSFGGSEFFHAKIKELEAMFPFGSRKTQSFVFTGIEMHQQSDNSIVMSQKIHVQNHPNSHSLST